MSTTSFRAFKFLNNKTVYKNSSVIKTTAQQAQATGNRPAPNHESAIPMTSAIIPATGDCVASTIAGNVITARVIYGT